MGWPAFVKIVARVHSLILKASVVFVSWPAVAQLEFFSTPSLKSLLSWHWFVFYVFQ